MRNEELVILTHTPLSKMEPKKIRFLLFQGFWLTMASCGEGCPLFLPTAVDPNCVKPAEVAGISSRAGPLPPILGGSSCLGCRIFGDFYGSVSRIDCGFFLGGRGDFTDFRNRL